MPLGCIGIGKGVILTMVKNEYVRNENARLTAGHFL